MTEEVKLEKVVKQFKYKKEKILSKEFFKKDCLEVSEKLIGKVLVHKKSPEITIAGRIIETEAYLGGDDKASHSYLNKENKKNKSMFLEGGFIYVYLSFQGKSPCFNITTDKKGVGSAVLIRGIEPLEGLEFMKTNSKKKVPNKNNLCNGPAKICWSFDFDMELDGKSLDENSIFVYDDDFEVKKIIQSKRINIDYAKEWAEKEYRFCLEARKGFLSRPY
eukprot:gene12024-5423_t